MPFPISFRIPSEKLSMPACTQKKPARAAFESAAVDHVAVVDAARHGLQRLVVQLEVVDLGHVRLGLFPRHLVVPASASSRSFSAVLHCIAFSIISFVRSLLMIFVILKTAFLI